jgi:integrase
MPLTLTNRMVESIPVKDRPYEVRDTKIRGLVLRIQPSGYKCWILQWGHKKRKTLGPLGHLSLDQARTTASHLMAEVIQSGVPSLAKSKSANLTLRKFIDEQFAPWAKAELRTGHQLITTLDRAFGDFMGLALHEIDINRLEIWWRKRLTMVSKQTDKPVQRTTAAREFAGLRSTLSKAVDWGVLKENAIKGMRIKDTQSRKIVRNLSPDEETRLRAALKRRDGFMIAARESGNRWRQEFDKPLYPTLPAHGYGDHLTPVVMIAMNTGLRRGELMSLNWSDIDFGKKILTVRRERAKNGNQRHIPLNAEATKVLTQWRSQESGEDQVFRINDPKKAWSGVLEAAAIKEFRFHDLRHHFASRLVMLGVDLNTVRELLGHADLTMTLRYAHLAPEHLAAAVEKLAA